MQRRPGASARCSFTIQSELWESSPDPRLTEPGKGLQTAWAHSNLSGNISRPDSSFSFRFWSTFRPKCLSRKRRKGTDSCCLVGAREKTAGHQMIIKRSQQEGGGNLFPVCLLLEPCPHLRNSSLFSIKNVLRKASYGSDGSLFASLLRADCSDSAVCSQHGSLSLKLKVFSSSENRSLDLRATVRFSFSLAEVQSF